MKVVHVLLQFIQKCKLMTIIKIPKLTKISQIFPCSSDPELEVKYTEKLIPSY